MQDDFASSYSTSRSVQDHGTVSCKSAAESEPKVNHLNPCVSQFLTCSTEPSFDVDIRKLESRYKQLQKDLHPDKFGNQEPKAQQYSAEQSSLVNHAYVKLKSPLQRALYLVSHLIGAHSAQI